MVGCTPLCITGITLYEKGFESPISHRSRRAGSHGVMDSGHLSRQLDTYRFSRRSNSILHWHLYVSLRKVKLRFILALCGSIKEPSIMAPRMAHMQLHLTCLTAVLSTQNCRVL